MNMNCGLEKVRMRVIQERVQILHILCPKEYYQFVLWCPSRDYCQCQHEFPKKLCNKRNQLKCGLLAPSGALIAIPTYY